MKKISLLLFIGFLIGNTNAQSQFYQKIKGIVVDKDTEYPLVGVNVVLLNKEDSFNGVTTDLDGRFELAKVKLGRQTIQLSYVGYKSITIPNILVNSAKENILFIKMEEDLIQLESIVITANNDRRKPVNEMAAISARSMTMEEVTRFSGSNGDVARMAQNYAGVSGSNDDRNDIIVRGNSPSGVLWRMEGVDIPSPNHWSSTGSSGGPISMINTNNLRNSDFLSGAFPAEYGNATAAVFDLKLRNGNADKFEFLGQVGFNGFEGGIEGPLGIGKRSSFVANYRYSTLEVFNVLGIDLGLNSSIPQYQDATFKINVPTSNFGTFSLWGFGGVSEIKFVAEQDENKKYDLGDQNLVSGSKTGVIGLSHLFFIDKNTSSKISVVLSTSNNNTTGEEMRDSFGLNFTKFFSVAHKKRNIGVNWTLNKKLNSQNRVKFGLIYDNKNLKVLDSVYVDDSFWFTETDYLGTTSMYRSFVQWQYKLNEKMTLISGIHGMYFGLNDNYSIEPRISFSYEASKRTTIAIGYGRHSQIQPLPIYFSKDRNATPEQNAKNLELDMIKSDQIIASVDYLFSKNTRAKFEIYYQSLFNLAVSPQDPNYSTINDGANFDYPNITGLVNDGVGNNKGVELTLERFLTKGFYMLFTASFFDSKYSGYNKKEHNTYYNSNFVFNLLAGKEFIFNKKHALSIDVKINYAGGRRFTPIELEKSIENGGVVYDGTKIYEGRFKPYIRPDLKIGYRKNSKRLSHTFSIDFQNLINRRNEYSHYYNDDEKKIKTTYQRGFFPNVTYQVLF